MQNSQNALAGLTGTIIAVLSIMEHGDLAKEQLYRSACKYVTEADFSDAFKLDTVQSLTKAYNECADRIMTNRSNLNPVFESILYNYA